jgi:UDP-2-acetamido-3-amino-2,3-dideoxy-glucuronate N-acetyltransferase
MNVIRKNLPGRSKLLSINCINDHRGNLSVIDNKDFDIFDMKRIFWVYDVPRSSIRGEHAHKKLHQFLLCINGTVNVDLHDGVHRESIILNDPKIGLHIPNLVWAEQFNYSQDAKLMVLCSDSYDESDYIRNFNDFLNYIK